jgi:hypothetical protein
MTHAISLERAQAKLKQFVHVIASSWADDRQYCSCAAETITTIRSLSTMERARANVCASNDSPPLTEQNCLGTALPESRFVTPLTAPQNFS